MVLRKRVAALLVGAAALLVFGALPAWAHGEGGESDPVNAVEQALAIVVNTPDASDEALERIEVALATEAEEPSGELDVARLEEAAAALKRGQLHEAEDALVAALGQDPHAQSSEPSDHGLTERIDGGLRMPSGAESAVLAVAILAGLGGVGLIRRHGGNA